MRYFENQIRFEILFLFVFVVIESHKNHKKKTKKFFFYKKQKKSPITRGKIKTTKRKILKTDIN